MKLSSLIDQLRQILAADGDIDVLTPHVPSACPECLYALKPKKFSYDEPDIEISTHPEAIQSTRVRVVLIR